MIKDFFKKNDHLKFIIQHLGINDGGWQVEIYNTTSGNNTPCYRHFYSDFEIDNLVIDFEAAIMTPIISWWEESQERYIKWLEEEYKPKYGLR